MTVRDIINACSDTIQYTGTDIKDMTKDEESAALAYEKLQHLHTEFTDQFIKKRNKEEISKDASKTMQQFFEEYFAKSRLAKEETKKNKAPDPR